MHHDLDDESKFWVLRSKSDEGEDDSDEDDEEEDDHGVEASKGGN